MDKFEDQINQYIDALNAEKKPEKHQEIMEDPEMVKLASTVRSVRTLREPAFPEPGFPKRLAKAAADRINADKLSAFYHTRDMKKNAHHTTGRLQRKWVIPSAAIAAVLLLFAVLNFSGLMNPDIVAAMEKTVHKVNNYHGILEIRSENANAEEWIVNEAELWSEGDKYAVRQSDGTLTVNNGMQKWQVRPEKQEVALLPAVPDPTRNSFDLRDEAKRARQYPHKALGTEMIAGRQSTKVEISPPGGLAYYLWIDNQTNLPVQMQTAMQNALRTTYTFVSLETNTGVNAEIFTYQPPEGFTVVEEDPGQLVASVSEAAAINQFIPLLPREAPSRIFAFEDRMVLEYGDTTIIEKVAESDLQPAVDSSLGTAAGGPLEVWGERLRWQQAGIEIEIEGSKRVDLARQIASDLILPDQTKDLISQAQVIVPVDMEIVKANQQQVDRGSSPWQLDPLQVALTFVNLKVTPEGIVGEPVIPVSSFKLAENNGSESVVGVASGPVKKVYLKRLVRTDETGVWSVVGYDPR